MKYVLDANVALKWVLPESDSQVAIRIRDEFAQGMHELLAPDVFPVEIAHSLAKAERQGKIKVGEGLPKMQDVFTFLPDQHPYQPLLARAFGIASAARIGVYDCLYVVLADQEGCELLTGDMKLVNALKKQFPFITPLSSLP